MGSSLNVFSSVARSVISGSAGFFLRAFSYAGDWRVRRARLTMLLQTGVSQHCHCLSLDRRAFPTSEHVLPVAIENDCARLEVLGTKELGESQGNGVRGPRDDGLCYTLLLLLLLLLLMLMLVLMLPALALLLLHLLLHPHLLLHRLPLELLDKLRNCHASPLGVDSNLALHRSDLLRRGHLHLARSTRSAGRHRLALHGGRVWRIILVRVMKLLLHSSVRLDSGKREVELRRTRIWVWALCANTSSFAKASCTLHVASNQRVARASPYRAPAPQTRQGRTASHNLEPNRDVAWSF